VTEEQLLAAARRGDHGAFATLLDSYDRPLRALAYRLLGERGEMDDAMQEAAVKAFVGLGLGSFNGRSSFATWMYRITYTTCLNLLRSHERVPEPVDPESVGDDSRRRETAGPTAPAGDVAVEVSERLDLEQALRSLTSAQRAAVCLVLELGLSLEEAAEILEVPAGTVSSRLWHARAVLKKCLGPFDQVRSDE
jgi:RNA polymerase sigma-70 factor (ECF subfamily)